jgi:hypothetical protein
MWSGLVLAQVVSGDPKIWAVSGERARELEKERQEKVEQVSIRAKPPARSASDWEIDTDTIASVPHETAADVLGVLPGVYVSNRGLLGQAPHLALRGFEGTTGQDTEIFVGNVPMNQASHIRGPGYADMRLIPPEVVRSVRVSHGPYDPRQGDGALAGSANMELGMEKPGFLGKATGGSFGARRLLLAFRPEDREWGESFAAFETYGIDGPGWGRSGERSSFVGHLAWVESDKAWRNVVAIGSARFDFPGFLPQENVERGAYPYGTTSPLGRDRTSQTFAGTEFTWGLERGTISVGAFASKAKTQIRQDLTGFFARRQPRRPRAGERRVHVRPPRDVPPARRSNLRPRPRRGRDIRADRHSHRERHAPLG